jgi:hypothetical protein
VWKDDKRINWGGDEPDDQPPIKIQINKVPMQGSKGQRSKKIF